MHRETFREPLDEMVKAKGGAGALFGIGLVVAIWSASGYIGAFMRALNAVYGVKERRPFWKLRPLQIVLTLGMVLALTLVLVALVITGLLAKAVGDAVGLGDTAVEAWNIAKWPALVLVVMVTFASLYHTAPNVRPRKFRLVTWGSVIAVLAWLGASAGFTFYVAKLPGDYSTKADGVVARHRILPIWLWISTWPSWWSRRDLFSTSAPAAAGGDRDRAGAAEASLPPRRRRCGRPSWPRALPRRRQLVAQPESARWA